MTTVSLLILSLAAADAGHQPASRGVLLDFTATWCGPCQQMNPIVSRLKRQGYPVRKVDVDQERALAQQFNVRSMPTFILVVDGKERNRIVGMTSEAQLRRMLAQIPNDPEPSVIGNPDPRNIAAANTGSPRNTQVAVNETPASRTRTTPGFTFPFGGNGSPKADAPSEPAVIRAKLDQKQPKKARISVEEDPLASSVRVRITNEGGVNYGSGTIIESKPGKTLILTCGHIFRDLKPSAQIEIDAFTGTQTETFVGKTLGYDLDGDVGLLSVASDSALPVSAIAGTDQEVKVRQGVYSIGCGGGDPPSREDLYVTALNRYLGPDNIECTGEPLQGRSGGGLFNSDGQVVGVCVAADPRDKRGLYAGLEVIHNLLKSQDLAELIPGSPLPEEPAIAKADAEPPGEKPKNVASPATTAVAKGNEDTLPHALSKAGEAEVICIIRPLDQPKSASEVVIINRASSRFVSYLTEELQGQPVPTMHREPLPQTNPEPPPFAQSSAIEAPPFAHEANRVSEPTESVQRYRRRREP